MPSLQDQRPVRATGRGVSFRGPTSRAPGGRAWPARPASRGPWVFASRGCCAARPWAFGFSWEVAHYPADRHRRVLSRQCVAR